MARKNDDELTTDDLLRLQEGPSRKRIRVAYSTSFDSEPFVGIDDESGSASSETHPAEPEENSQGEDDTFSHEIGDELSESDRAKLGAFEDSGRLKLSRTSQTERTAEPRPPQTPKCSTETFSDMGVSSVLEAALHRIRLYTTDSGRYGLANLLGTEEIASVMLKQGPGKTIAFAIPILQKLSDDPYGIFALVLTPTRELAFQISEQFAVLGASLSIRTSVIVGGMDMMTQALELDGRPHVVVATPGRIVDHLKSSSGGWDLSRIKFLVLDEADRLLTPTFTLELSHLFNILPTDRQTCLFTATLTPSVESVASMPPKQGKMKPFFHRTESTVETVASLKQRYVLVPSHVRESYLFYLLCHPPEETLPLRRAPPVPTKKSGNPKNGKPKSSRKNAQEEEEVTQPPPTIIFCTKPRTAAYLTSLLKTLSIRSTALHSRLTQRERLASLSLFRSAVVPILVSTDVGARGLDIEDVAMVINWDLPNEPEEYTHRVGRTARAGKGGVALSFVTEKDEQRILRIEDRIGIKLTALVLPEDKVLDKLDAVSTAKRLANMELHDSNFGQREEIYKIKSGKRRQPECSISTYPKPVFNLFYSSSVVPGVMSISLENTDWDFVLQFVSEPLDIEMPAPEKPVSGWVEPASGVPATQVPTPPESFTASPVDSPPDDNAIVSVSTTFFPGAQNHVLPPDLVLLSSDSVFFYVHTHILLTASDNNFNSLLPPSSKEKPGSMGPVVLVPETSTVLNIVLHAVYDKSCSHYSPSFESLVAALHAMTTYGVSLQTHVSSTTSLHGLLLSLAPICPLELYALAASYDLYDLAIPTSTYLLSFSLASLTDEMAERIGPLYLKRLFFLHFGRADALKRILLPPPQPHPPTPTCDFVEQKRLTRAWALASAYLAWDARPDLSTSTLESALAPLGDRLSCESCRQTLQERLKTLIVQWSAVKRTI
ncbi:P-loop containing nucleoside triphosphate hydrolase protein [Chiua virens]|nr:P-loop containing nucleoside triphosphate hydrolase protein [Chiua virens]